MAYYKYGHFLTQLDNVAFDDTHSPGTSAPHPGIYRCTSCGDEIAIAGGNTLPPQNHKQHDPNLGSVAWRLVVYAVQNS